MPPALLTRGPVVAVGTAPSALAITADGGFLYVANASTVSGFADLQPGRDHLQRSH